MVLAARRALQFAAFTVAVAVTGACSEHIPAVAPAPPIAEARGVKVVLFATANDRSIDSNLPDLFEASLKRAGFTVVWAGQAPAPPASQAYDFAIGYSRAFGYWKLNVSLSGAELDMDRPLPLHDEHVVNWSGGTWGVRLQAITEGRGGATEPAAKDMLRSCAAGWNTVRGNSPNPGDLSAPPDGMRISVYGPSERITKDDDERAATKLVTALTSCPGFVSLLRTIRDSGVAAASPMEKLPAPALMNLCKASGELVNPDNRIALTGSLKTLDDACTLAEAADAGLAPAIATFRAERAERFKAWAVARDAQVAEPVIRSSGGSNGSEPRPQDAASGQSSGLSAGVAAATQTVQQGLKDIERQKREAEEMRKKIERCAKLRREGLPCD